MLKLVAARFQESMSPLKSDYDGECKCFKVQRLFQKLRRQLRKQRNTKGAQAYLCQQTFRARMCKRGKSLTRCFLCDRAVNPIRVITDAIKIQPNAEKELLSVAVGAYTACPNLLCCTRVFVVVDC